MAQEYPPSLVHAPEFPQGLEWLNTGHPLSLHALRGNVVLLDFWTFCCINCMHIIPDLKKLEAEFHNDLVVIGVHSAKFTTEQGTENIRQAILRYGLTHPVVNDKDFDIWNAYGVHAWPTLVLIDPEGRIVDVHAGEGVYAALRDTIARVVRNSEARGLLKHSPPDLALEKSHQPETFLHYPGKVAADATGQRLFISDSNHNRIVIASAAGEVLDVIGSGEGGLQDGSFADAQFRNPQGLAVDGDVVYVADTDNHAIRRIDLRRKTVSTLAGNGTQAPGGGVPGSRGESLLNSPWDLTLVNGVLYVAMAGAHQIWTVQPSDGRAAPFAGSGREAIIDGSAADAAFAQPSGITTDGTDLYIADSEDSGIRRVTTGTRPRVRTLVGKGLFDFGDVDGSPDRVRLQHPIGITWHAGTLYVADTYNNKIKTVDPNTGRTWTLAGNGTAGLADGAARDAELNEPNGLVALGDTLLITDTNNHLLRFLDLRSKMVHTLPVKGMDRFVSGAAKKFSGEPLALQEQQVASGSGSIAVTVSLPDAYKLNGTAPFYIGYFSADQRVVHIDAPEGGQNIADPQFPLSVPAVFSPGRTNLEVDLVVYYCQKEKEELCLFRKLKVTIPVVVGAGATMKTLNLTVPVTS